MANATAQMALLILMQMGNRSGIVMVNATALTALLGLMQMAHGNGLKMANSTAQMDLLEFGQMVIRSGTLIIKTSPTKSKHGWRRKMSLGPGTLQLKYCSY